MPAKDFSDVMDAKSYPIFTTTAGDERNSQSWVNHKDLLESHNRNRLLMWRKYMRWLQSVFCIVMKTILWHNCIQMKSIVHIRIEHHCLVRFRVERWGLLLTCWNSDTPIITIIEMQIGGWERAFVARHVLQIYFGRKGREGERQKMRRFSSEFLLCVREHA